MSRYLKFERVDVKRVELDADTNRRVILPLDEQYEALRIQVTGADNVLLYINKKEDELIPENGILLSDFDLEFKDLAIKKLALELYLPNEPIEPAPEEPIEPSEPEEPTPSEPNEPSEPENGGEGGDPTEPTDPTPSEPENGGEVEEPTDPTPEEPENGGDSGDPTDPIEPTPSEPENGGEGGDPTDPTPEEGEESTDPTPEDDGEVEPLALVSDTDEIFCRSAKVQILLMK